MNVHKNARLTPHGRERIIRQVQSGQTPKAVAEAAGVCPRTVRKWVERYRREGLAGLRDRSSRPHHLYRPTPQALVEQVEALRRQRRTGQQIAAEVHISPATVSRILRRLGLNRIGVLEPSEPVRRYERDKPGEMIHIDIKKLGRIDGIGHRITGFLKAALAYYESLGVKVERVMTDNGSCYKSFAFRRACKRFGLKHIRTKPYTPKTNGKAERFIQTCLREWAYAQAYNHSRHRTGELPYWLHRYNWHRPHAGIGAKTPISRLGLAEDNLLRLHS
jgi:transposase